MKAHAVAGEIATQKMPGIAVALPAATTTTIVGRDVLGSAAGLAARDDIPGVFGDDEDDDEIDILAAVAAYSVGF